MPSGREGLGGRALNVEAGGFAQIIAEPREERALTIGILKGAIRRKGAIPARVFIAGAGRNIARRIPRTRDAGHERSEHAVTNELHACRQRAGGRAPLDQSAKCGIGPSTIYNIGEWICDRSRSHLCIIERAVWPVILVDAVPMTVLRRTFQMPPTTRPIPTGRQTERIAEIHTAV